MAKSNATNNFPLLPSKIFIVLIKFRVFDPFWTSFWICYKLTVNLILLYGYSVCPVPFDEKTVLSRSMCLASLSKISWPYIWEFISSFSLFLFFGLYVYSYVSIPTGLLTVALWYILKSEHVNPTALFQDSFGHLEFLEIPYEFQFSMPAQIFDRDCTEYTDHFRYYCHLNNLKFSSPWTCWDVFPFI